MSAYFSIIIHLFIFQVGVWASEMQFKAGESTFNPEHVRNCSLSIKNQQLNFDIDLIKPFVNGLKVRLEFELRQTNGKAYQRVYQHEFSLCSVLASYKQSIYKRWMDSMIQGANFVKTCPVKPSHYYLHNWTVSGSLVPTFFYLGDYRIKALLYYGKNKTKSENIVITFSVLTILK